MRSRRLILIVLCLLCAAGVWLFQHQTVRRVAETKAAATTVVAPSSVAVAPPLTNPLLVSAAEAKTNPFAYRLSNTTRSLGQLTGDRNAILLENALIDTGSPLNFSIPKQLQAQGDPGSYIVQSRGPINAAFRALLARAGAQIVSYIPNDAYLVKVSEGGANALAAMPPVQSVIRYEPYYKIQSSLLGAAVNHQMIGAPLTLGLFADNAAQTIQQIQKLGGRILARDESPFGPVVRVQPPADWTALATLPGVQIVEPYHPRVHANDLSRVNTGVSVDTLTNANYLGLSGSNVTVVVIDSGIDATHPGFTTGGSLGAAGAAPIRVLGLTTNDLVDTEGHGTFVAGQIAGNGDMSTSPVNVGAVLQADNYGSVSNADFRGDAPLADLFSIKLGQPDQFLQETAAQVTNALIANCSWVDGGDNTYNLDSASFDAATRDSLPGVTGSQPMLYVFAAGNAGNGDDTYDPGGGTHDTIQAPATAKNVVTVGAIQEQRDITNLVTMWDGTTNDIWFAGTSTSYRAARFSSRGNVGVGIEGAYGRFKPDVVAPGTFIVSTRSSQWDTNAYFYDNPTNIETATFDDIVADPDSLWFNGFPIVPDNAISVNITVSAAPDSPNPFPTNPIYFAMIGSPFPGTLPTPISIPNQVNIPSDGGFSIQAILDSETFYGFNYGISNITSQPFSFDLTTTIVTTNAVGNEGLVLSNLDNTLGPYYRFESGTSMAAADVSGTLALMQDLFTNTLHTLPSPALLKAMLINGARPTGLYNLQVNNSINFTGWGLVNLPNSMPPDIQTNFDGSKPSAIFFQDQSTANALATGDSHTFKLTAMTNTTSLRVTLVWTDPPGNPAAAIKLVNNLQLVVTNTDNPTNPIVYYGNDIPAGYIFNTPENATNAVTPDSVNNVQNVIIPPNLGTNYTVAVIARAVNVNAVSAQTNVYVGTPGSPGAFAPNVVQDYALVVSSVDGGVPGAFTITDNGIIANPTGAQNITFVTTTNQPYLNQFVGATAPLIATNATPIGVDSVWGTNGQVVLGMTNQWHFYVATNTGTASDFTNAGFVTFLSPTLSVPRTGVFADTTADATRPQADIDLYVTTDPTLTNLNPSAIASCLNGGGVVPGSVFNGASLSRGGTEYVVDTNSKPGEVYYIGVKSEDQMAAEYDFLPMFSNIPFSQLDANGNEYVNGFPVSVQIPDGTPSMPGVNFVLGLAIYPINVGNITVTNVITHQRFGDLYGTLTHDQGDTGVETVDVLNNHDGIGSVTNLVLVYDDSGTNTAALPSDGPGSLRNFFGQDGSGVWRLTEQDNALTQTGSVQNFSMLIQPHQDMKKGIRVTIQPGTWYYNFIDVSAGYTNLSVFATNLPPTSTPPLQLYLNVTNRPDFSNYLEEADLTNGTPPGNSISYGPPLQPARYWVGVFNPDTVAHDVYLLAQLGGSLESVPPMNLTDAGPSLPSDAVAPDSITIANTDLIASANVGIVVAHPRISDLTFTLVSPAGQRILLMENRGGNDTNGAGSTFTYTNVLNSTATGGAAANTNYLAVPDLPGGFTVPITYNFYTVPDEMTVYAGDDPATFYLTSSTFLHDTGFTNNPPTGGGAQNTLEETINVSVPPGYTNITIIMNQFGNPYALGGDAWIYTAGAAVTNYSYLMFTEDTNLATLPIKFAEPPFSFAEVLSNYTLSDFELATNGNYLAPTNIYDAFGGWSMPTNKIVGTNSVLWTNNMVSVVTDPSDSLGDHVGSNFLALAGGTITRSIPTIPGKQYTVTFWCRGPGIAGWWRGEGDASDSSFPEGGNNGSLIGRFNFPAGEVGQAFELQDPGQPMEFAGTNTYVQVPQSPSLDAGTGGGLTVEGWINPTNVSQQMPLVEWLAKIPVFTNSPDTNFSVQAGPFLDRATGDYYYLLAPTNWTTSEIWATNLGGHLVTIDTANEQNWVYDTFANYGNTNRNLWIGLTNGAANTYVWSSGLTNIYYTNWANGQPTNCDGTRTFTFMFGNTNTPGLWTLANNNGFTCANPAQTNIVYGVVEVTNLQPNGVQFWISVTNTPGTTNAIFDGSGNLYTNGCLYANLVDTTNGSHEIYSAPGLIQFNIYQHVALTYDTNSGVAVLYYNGINVATTNLGVFVPKTGGDVLLGRDMSLQTNDYYGGELDEMSVYSRALSAAEIGAIYRVSATATNGLTGKFDPTVTPAYGLAEAQVVYGTTTNIIYGVNNQWELNSFTFTATSNAMPLQISGLQPGILLDDFAVSGMPLTNLYYLPEQSLDELAGQSADGTWTLQIWDNRANTAVTPADAQLLNWELQLTLQTNVLLAALPVDPENPTTITVPPGQTVFLSVAVPAWAGWATNILDSASGPVDLLFNPTNEPTGLNPGDQTLLTASTTGIGLPVLAVNSPFPLTQPNQAAQSYYLGVRNPGTHAVTAVVEADFDITGLSNGVPVSGVLNTNDSERYFAFDVSSNAFEATFQLLHLSGNADLVVRKGPPLPTLFSSDYGSFNTGGADENIYVLTNSMPVPLSPGRWYLGVFKRDAGPVRYAVLAKELDLQAGPPPVPNIIDLTNRVPLNFTAGPGAALTNFFRFNVANTTFLTTNAFGNVVTTNMLGSIHFALYNLSGNGDLTLQTNAPPLAPPFFESSQESGTSPELITIRTNGVVTNLVAQWYLGVPNHETNLITYTIVAVLDTNLVFPAFPTAEGAGADAVGGRFGDVYHVTSLADSGPGTLRAAISATNRTVVFDLSGTIGLLSPLVITNSFLTIAGQSAPGGGITVAGNMTTVQSAHDVVIRDVRFRSGVAGSIQMSGFEGANAADYTNGQGVASSGWTVLTNQVSLVSDSLNAYGGSNFLALANGVISNTLPTVAGNIYTFTFAYRGPGIVSMWRGETNANDSIGTNNGAPTGGITYSNGEVGQAFALNGSTSYIHVPASPSLDVGDNGNGLTIDGWINPNMYVGLPTPVVEWDYTISSSTADSLAIWVQDSLKLSGGFRDTTGINRGLETTSSVIKTNVLQHVAFTYNKSSGLEVLYVNGIEVLTNNVGTHTPQTTSPVNIGRRMSQPIGNGDNFGGLIDELSLYNRDLSASEIKAIYTNGIAGKYDPFVFNTSPAQSLAEAQVSVNGQTPATILGNNTNWQIETITFTATNSGTPVQISGIEPGMLLDSAIIVNPDDSLRLTNTSDVVVDHVSTSWSTNNDLSVLNSTNVTVQWSIMADSLYDMTHPHGYGSRLRYGNGALTFHHNLYSDNYNASPRLGDNLQLDFVNNVVYNWGLNAGFSTNENVLDDSSGFTNELNYVCNYLIAGSNSVMKNIAFWSGTTNTWIYQTNNFMDGNTNGILDGADTEWQMFTNHYTPFQVPFPPLAVGIDEAYQAYERVLDFAGTAMDKRDTADTNIVLKVRKQTGALISAAGTLPALNSALPYLDTDQDGIPDFWEKTFTPALVFVPSSHNDRDGDGYTDLEEYNNWLAGPHALAVTNTPVGVDLQQLFGKTGNLSFSVTNAVQGSVYLTNVLNYTNVSGTAIAVTNAGAFSNTFAIFTPTNNNYSGYASFDVYVTNNNTIAYFGPVTVSVIVSAVPVKINSNMPPVITPLISEIDPTNYGGSDFYKFTVATNVVGVLFQVTNISVSGGLDLLARYGLPLPSLSQYDYINTNTADEYIFIGTNSLPVPLTNGDWYLAVVNVNPSGGPVSYDIKATQLFSLSPPAFLSPTNADVFTNLETTLFTNHCVATDPNSPTLSLTFALASGPTNMTVSSGGAISWTPTEAQGPSTNSIAVSVSNGAYTVTNTFSVIVEESNLPPVFVLTNIPNQVVIVPGGTLVVTNTATDPDIPVNPLTYTLLPIGTDTNAPVIDTNGVITWVPTLADIGTNYLFTTIVTDTNPWAINATSLSATNSFYVYVPAPLVGGQPGQPWTNIVAPGGINWFAVTVPTNAIYATNTLLFASLPVNLLFSTNIPPTTTNAADVELLANVTNGSSVLSTNLATAPTNLVPGGIYFLGVQNTNSVAVTNVVEVDFALVSPLKLPVIPTQVITVGSTLAVTNTATDTNAGAVLVYTLSGAPASITANGIITWTPASPTSVVITTIVTDTDANISATNSFTVIVLPGLSGGGPQTNVVGANGINWFTVSVPTNAVQATNILRFATAPVNLWFSTNVPPAITNAADFEMLTDATGGSYVFGTSTVPLLVPGSVYYLGVQNTNNFAVTNAVEVDFHLVYPIFKIASIVHTNIGGTNGFLITWFAPAADQFQLQWTPSLLPTSWSTFNGIISYSTFIAATNSQFTYFDDGSQTGGFGPVRFYRLLLVNSPANTPPFFLNGPPASRHLNPLTLLTVTNAAGDWDVPAQSLAYAISNSLAGTNLAVIDPDGVITWTPVIAQGGQTNVITTVVTDNGTPAAGVTNVFTVIVNILPPFSSVIVNTNGVNFQWAAFATEQFQIQWTTNLAPPNWTLFPDIITSSNGVFNFTDTNTPLLVKFYELILLP